MLLCCGPETLNCTEVRAPGAAHVVHWNTETKRALSLSVRHWRQPRTHATYCLIRTHNLFLLHYGVEFSDVQTRLKKSWNPCDFLCTLNQISSFGLECCMNSSKMEEKCEKLNPMWYYGISLIWCCSSNIWHIYNIYLYTLYKYKWYIYNIYVWNIWNIFMKTPVAPEDMPEMIPFEMFQILWPCSRSRLSWWQSSSRSPWQT